MDEQSRPLLEEAEGTAAVPVHGVDAFVVTAWELHRGALYGFLLRSTRDEAAAEDLVQDAFLRLTGELRAGRAPDDLRAWLFAVAANLSISRGRRVSTAMRWLARLGRVEADDRTDESPERTLLRREEHDDMERILASLPVDARTALLLAGQGYRGEEIAAAIGRSHGATRTLLSRARLRIRDAVAASEAAR